MMPKEATLFFVLVFTHLAQPLPVLELEDSTQS